MTELKALKPVNAGRIGPDMPLIINTVHRQILMQTLQKDETQSSLLLTINEDYRGVIWIGIDVDGKFHALDSCTKELIEYILSITTLIPSQP